MTADEIADFVHDACPKADEITRGESILSLADIGRDRAERSRLDDDSDIGEDRAALSAGLQRLIDAAVARQ